MAKRIISIWVLVQVVFFGSLLVFNHSPVDIWTMIYDSLSLLLFIMSVYLTVHESQTRTKLLFVNFSLFFGLSVYYCLYPFIGFALFTHSTFAKFFSIQYVQLGLFSLLLAQSLGFICLDALLNGSRPNVTYVISFCIVAGFWLYLFLPYISDPLYLYDTPDAKDYKALVKEFDNSHSDHLLSQGELSNSVQLVQHQGSSKGLPLDPVQNKQRIIELYPYLFGSNYVVLLMRPLEMVIIKMFLLSTFFGFVYIIHRCWTTPRHSGYLMKWIVILMFVFCAEQALRSWIFTESVAWSSLNDFVPFFGLLEAVNLTALAIVLAIRFRFIRASRNASPLQVEEGSLRSRKETRSDSSLQFVWAWIRLQSA